MDVAKAFTFVTEDEGWIRKIGIGALVMLLSFLLVPLILLPGYMAGVTRNVMKGVERPLPEWEDFGGLFKDGLAIMVAQFVYTLPIWILVCVAVAITAGLGGAGVSEDVAAAGFAVTWIVISCLTLILGIALFFLSPAIVIQYVRTGEFGASFRVREIAAIARENIGDIMIAALASFAASLILSVVITVLGIIPCIGWVAAPILGLAAGPYSMVVIGHLYGQIAAKSAGASAALP
ncbi:MAG: DUF4013 domain-containing protein [Anaerolineae bacterium]